MQYHNQFPMTATGKLHALFGDDVLADIWRTL